MNVMKKIIECVPNFSEGRDESVIEAIATAIRGVSGVKLLHIDPGHAANRTVYTFVGEPDAVIEAAFQAMKKAQETIDMSQQKGEHPRFGGTDVCPLIPIANISMEEVMEYADRLAKRVGEELAYPVYLYEHSAKVPARKNLAYVRSGEYEGLTEKLKTEIPDYGPAVFHPRSGATAIGARDFLIAYNVNLNTNSVDKANEIAGELRESGRLKRDGSGNIIRDENGKSIRIPGRLKGVKCIGWYIKEYRVAQVSMNVTKIQETPLHVVFDHACKVANEVGVEVTGSELVGMVPLKVLTDAGAYFLMKEGKSTDVSEKELVKEAVRKFNFADVTPFTVEEKVIEYLLAD